jgi:hypothetical protein
MSHGLNGEEKDLFCRVNIDARLPHNQFVNFLARRVGGTSEWNLVSSRELDIIVDENDVFDPAMSVSGEDRWLYFPYTLEIDPIAGVSSQDYIAAVANLLTSLWSAGMDAVAACEFEDELPQNERRLT